jgi:hypothetical protein
LPLEYGYARVLLEQAGHEALLIDCQLEILTTEEMRRRVAAFTPRFTVVTTAPSYLFWRCPQHRVPIETVRELRDAGGTMVVIGPHGSTTPKTTLRKLDADVVMVGECEDLLPRLTEP